MDVLSLVNINIVKPYSFIPEIIVFFVLTSIASFIDLKKKEVYDILTFGSTFYAMILSIVYSLIFSNTKLFLYSFIIGISIFFIGYLFYLAGLFGGGDVKIAPGIFIMINILLFNSIKNYSIINLIQGYIIYIIVFSLVNIIYSAIILLYYVLKEFSKIKRNISRIIKKNLFIFIFVLLTIFISFFISWIVSFSLLVMMIFLVLVFGVEEIAFIKKKKIKELSVGDWLVKDIRIGNVVIKKRKTGLSEDDIRRLKKTNINYIKIKEGIALIPVFSISFLIFVIFIFI